jgi:hypothetical protein
MKSTMSVTEDLEKEIARLQDIERKFTILTRKCPKLDVRIHIDSVLDVESEDSEEESEDSDEKSRDSGERMEELYEENQNQEKKILVKWSYIPNGTEILRCLFKKRKPNRNFRFHDTSHACSS